MAATRVASAAIRQRLRNGHGNPKDKSRDPVATPSVLLTPDSEDGTSSVSGSPPIVPFAPTTTSTPNRRARTLANPFYSETTDSESTSSTTSPADDTQFRAGMEPPKFRAPILGYEIMEQRAKFTVFKIHVQHLTSNEGWFVFRRYTDFARLNRKLRGLFPLLRLGLPPKRWFRNNFEQSFLDERLRGLQTFVNNVLSFTNSSTSIPVQDFFCLDDTPGPDDSIEESRARCETLEELVSALRMELCEKQVEVEILRAELALNKAQKGTLARSLRIENDVSDVDSTVLTTGADEMTQLYHTAFEDQDDSTFVEPATTNGERMSCERKVASETMHKVAPFSMDSNGNQMVESNEVVQT